ncbi:MAG: guanylate kinase [Desulfotomaculales bacterium]
MQGLLLVVSGPSGVGKGTICAALLRRLPDLHLSISATTRSPRPGERNGVEYFFVSEAEFARMLAAGELLEWAEVHGARYGTPRRPVLDALDRGEDVLLEIDVQGGLQVKKSFPDAVLIFVLPPSMEELQRRLAARGKDSPEAMGERLAWAHKELQRAPDYDYVVVNETVDGAVAEILSIMAIEKRRKARQAGER